MSRVFGFLGWCKSEGFFRSTSKIIRNNSTRKSFATSKGVTELFNLDRVLDAIDAGKSWHALQRQAEFDVAYPLSRGITPMRQALAKNYIDKMGHILPVFVAER